MLEESPPAAVGRRAIIARMTHGLVESEDPQAPELQSLTCQATTDRRENARTVVGVDSSSPATDSVYSRSCEGWPRADGQSVWAQRLRRSSDESCKEVELEASRGMRGRLGKKSRRQHPRGVRLLP
nr:hypothetical protein CFP56_29887 [Quercus suber]